MRNYLGEPEMATLRFGLHDLGIEDARGAFARKKLARRPLPDHLPDHVIRPTAREPRWRRLQVRRRGG